MIEVKISVDWGDGEVEITETCPVVRDARTEVIKDHVQSAAMRASARANAALSPLERPHGA